MSTYREIVGKKIKKVSSDPSSGTEGEMWYNSTTGTLRGPAIVEAWVSAAPLGTGRYQSGSFGTQTAGVAFCGAYTPSQTQSLVEHYNGTGWSEETNFPAAGTAVAGAGTQTAGIAAGGSTPSMTTNAFSYDGSSWTAANAMPYAANNLASCGLAKTSVIYAVGRDGSSGNSGTNKSLTFDGTNFAAGPTLNTTRMYNVTSGSGTGTAGLVFGGFIDPSPNAMTNTESYNGSSWSNEPALNVASSFCAGFGTQTNTVTQVNTPNYEGSEKFDGTSWTALPDIGVASPGGLYGASAGATGDSGMISAMSPTWNKTAEWTSSINSITAGAWASGTAMNTPAAYRFGMGTSTTTLAAGGSPLTGNSEEHNGTSWVEGTNLGTSRYEGGSAGTQTAGLAFGGYSTTHEDKTEEYDGSSWTSQNTLNTAGYSQGGFGIQTAAVYTNRFTPGLTADTEEYNGTSWSEGNNSSTSRADVGTAGTLTAGLIFGGQTPPPVVTGATEEYDGTNWTTGNAMNNTRSQLGGSGIQTAAIAFGGRYTPPGSVLRDFTEQYDGTTWSTAPSLGTAKRQLSSGRGADGSSSNNAAIAMGGKAPSVTTATEIFTGETTAVNIGDFTTS